MNVLRYNFVKNIECFRSSYLGFYVYIAKVIFFNHAKATELKNLIKKLVNNNIKSITVGIPTSYNISPCTILQAYLYYKEDLYLTKKPRIKNPALHILSYIFMETQIFKIVENITDFTGVYIVSSEKLKHFCKEENYKLISCKINELTKLAKYRIENML